MRHPTRLGSTVGLLVCLVGVCAACSTESSSGTAEVPPSVAADPSTASSAAARPSSTLGGQAPEPTSTNGSGPVSESLIVAAADFEPFTIAGSGDYLGSLSIPGDAIAILDITYAGEGSFSVRDYWTGSADEDECVDCDHTNLYLTEAGPYHGRHLVNHRLACEYRPSVPLRSIGVLAAGPWSISVEPLGRASVLETSLSGEGNDVVVVRAAGVLAEVDSIASLFAYSFDGREGLLYSQFDQTTNPVTIPDWVDVIEILDHDGVPGWTITVRGGAPSSEPSSPPEGIPVGDMPGAAALTFSIPLDPNIEWIDVSGPAVEAGLMCASGHVEDVAYFDADGLSLTVTEFNGMMDDAYGGDSEPERSPEYTTHSEFTCGHGTGTLVMSLHNRSVHLPIADPVTTLGDWSIIEGTGDLEGLVGNGTILLDMESFSMNLTGSVLKP